MTDHQGWSRALRELEEQKQLYQDMVEIHPFIVERYLPDTTITYANRAAAEFFGYSQEALVGMRWIELVPPEERENIWEILRSYTPEQPVHTFENWATLSDGSVRLTQWTDRAFFDETGRLTHFHAVGMDITEQRRAEQQLQRQRDFSVALGEYGRCVVAGDLDPDTVLHMACRVAVERTDLRLAWIGVPSENGWIRPVASYGAPQEVLDQIGVCTDPASPEESDPAGVAFREARTVVQPRILNHLEMGASHDTARATELRSALALPIYRGGHVAATLSLYAGVEDFFDQEVVGYLEHLALTASMALESHDQKREWQRLAHHDPVTELLNRRSFSQRLEEEWSRAQRSGTRGAVLQLDLDDFKAVNDSFGHAVGDALLKGIAHRLKANIRREDIVARLGGDEFAVIVTNLDGDAEQAARRAEDVAQKVLGVFSEPFTTGGRQLAMSASLGIALFPETGSDPEMLLQQADTTMYHAKANGPGERRFYDPYLLTEVRRRLELEQDLRGAPERDEFSLAYQPVVCMETNQVVGMEALLRWHHPEQGPISPAEFIPVAERTGLIQSMGHWVLREALRQLRAWREAGMDPGPLGLAINVSPCELVDPTYAERVADALAHYEIPGHWLKLEITEEALIRHLSTAVARMELLRETGVRFALDDFGTGYSSLSYLRHLPVESIKLDRTLIADICTSVESAAIADAVVTLGERLQLDLIAEGVETEAQARDLARRGYSLGQGYYWGAPGAAVRPGAALRGGLGDLEREGCTRSC